MILLQITKTKEKHNYTQAKSVYNLSSIKHAPSDFMQFLHTLYRAL